MLILSPTARRIAAGCCNYIYTRFPPGHAVPVCEIDQEWFADLAQKEIAAGQEGGEPVTAADLRARVAELERALRYAAECPTLEMVRDTARGMGVVG